MSSWSPYDPEPAPLMSDAVVRCAPPPPRVVTVKRYRGIWLVLLNGRQAGCSLSQSGADKIADDLRAKVSRG